MSILNSFFLKFFVLFFFSVSFSFANNVESERIGIVSYHSAVTKAAPAVVSIQTTQEIPINTHPMFNDPIFKFFFGEQQEFDDNKNSQQQKQLQQGLGSGVVVDKRGYILTNNHVIKDATSIIIRLSDGRISETDKGI